MTNIEAFVDEIKSSQVDAKIAKSGYIARKTHAKIQERNERFKEFIQSDEAIALIKDVKNNQRLKTLANLFKEKFNEPMPLVSAYSIYNQLQKEQN